jgi:phosphate transport system permease protein
MTEALRSDTTRTVKASLRRRYAAERRFKAYGVAAIGVALLMLGILFGTIIANGWSAFRQTHVQMEVLVDAAEIDPDGNRDPKALSRGDYEKLIKFSLREMFPDVKKRKEKRELYDLVSNGAAFDLRADVLANPSLVGQTVSMWVPASDDVDMYMKGYISAEVTEDERRVSDKQIARVESSCWARSGSCSWCCWSPFQWA